MNLIILILSEIGFILTRLPKTNVPESHSPVSNSSNQQVYVPLPLEVQLKRSIHLSGITLEKSSQDEIQYKYHTGTRFRPNGEGSAMKAHDLAGEA